jgi:two-component system sensor histidine kinase YesM
MANWIAYEKGLPEICTILNSLSVFFRISLSSKTYHTVKKEMEHVYAYCKIQELRTRGNIKFIYEIDDDIEECKIQKLLIQPLIENSILHGIAPKGNKGLIVITVKRSVDNLIITVIDNGIGISKANESGEKENEGNKDSHGSGLKNIEERIKLSYGDSYGLILRDYIPEGTIAIMEIPCIGCKND